MVHTCSQCRQPFEVTAQEVELLKKLSPDIGGTVHALPAPTKCFWCRLQQRLAFHNEQNLFQRTCDKSGKAIVSMYPPNAPVKVYDCDVWYSDQWDPLEYGRDYDPSRSFFEQFADLLKNVPQLALSVVNEYNENSDFTNNNWKLKNCYLLSDAEECEDCYYGKGVENCKDCMDNWGLYQSELCFECVLCRDSYALRYCQFSANCNTSWFLRDCMGCSNCFGCCNLHQKEYCIFNEQKTKAEYEAFMKEFDSSSYSAVMAMKQKAEAFFATQPVRSYRGAQNVHCTGNNLNNSKDSIYCFDSANLENCCYLTRCMGGGNNSMDIHIWGTLGTELCHSGVVIGAAAQRILYSYFVLEQVHSILYSMYCMRGSSHLFGCIGLRHKEYCILNKQYSEEEYNQLVPQIIEKMKADGQWGEYFPAAMSPFGYNHTDAQEVFPLSSEQATAAGFTWNDYEPPLNASKVIPAASLPDNTNDIPDDVLNWAVECQVTKQPFKIIKQELEYLRRHRLPVPRLHPKERHLQRFKSNNPYRLYDRKCSKCQTDVQTTYTPDYDGTVLCEECYLTEVY